MENDIEIKKEEDSLKGQNMDVKIISSSKSGESVTREEFELFGGRIAGMNMMNESYEKMLDEERTKTQRRIKQTKSNGIHSVYAHNSITLYLDRVPKIILLILKSLKQEVSEGVVYEDETSSKTKILYKKWVDIFKNKLTKVYKQENPNITDIALTNIAKYYADYMTSIFAPVSMVYTTNYKAINYLISAFECMISKANKSDFEEKVTPYIQDLVANLKGLPFYDEELASNRFAGGLNLFADDKPTEEYFGDIYSTSYDASMLELCESFDFKALDFSMRVKEGEYYIPEIIADSESFSELWISDLKELEGTYPEATMITVHETGTLSAFLTKIKYTRQMPKYLEIVNITEDILKKYEYALRMKIHPRAEEIITYTKTEDNK